jgi:septum formation protein
VKASQLANRKGATQRRPACRKIKAIDDRLVRHQARDDTIEEKPRQNKVMPEPRRLILASSSGYRRQLLGRLGLQFECVSPEVDEAPMPGEAPALTAQRLATLKARSASGRFRDALIIGSDQVAALGSRRLDKPGNRANAIAQLSELSGKSAEFHTAVCLLDAQSGQLWTRVVPCRVRFRDISRAQIETYVDREQPFDCAGSAKSEGLGIALIAAIETEDPTSLIGLPLIALSELLTQAGMPVLG